MSQEPVIIGDREQAVSADALCEPPEAAAYLRCATQTLANWRSRGTGPRFVKLGSGTNAPVRYRLSDLHAWVNQREAA